MTRIMAFAGSARNSSFNKKLVRFAAEFAKKLVADVNLVDLQDFPLPLYDGDVEEQSGIPENAIQLRSLMINHDAFLLACPEYNGSITPLLKNVIDWTSRPSDNIPMTAAYRGKVAALLSASPGTLGGLRGLSHVRDILTGIGVHVLPQQASVGSAYSAFDENGTLTDAQQSQRVQSVIESLVATTQKLIS